jgi:hypothetical protein
MAAKKRRKKPPKAQTVVQIMDDVAQEICDEYCKYPAEWDPDEHDGMELFESEICANCPLMRLG